MASVASMAILGTQRLMSATPRNPKDSIDPLIGAHAHNVMRSRLTGLPREILLCILEITGDDLVTLYYLRRASRVFRLMNSDPIIWKRMRTRNLPI